MMTSHDAGVCGKRSAADLRLALHAACSQGDEGTVRGLLLQGVGLNSHSKQTGFTPLHVAVQQGHWNIVELLTSAGADPNLPISDAKDLRHLATMTPLMLAAGDLKIMATLLGAGANPDRQNNDGYTALHFSAYIGNLAAVMLLLKSGARQDLLTASRLTAFQIAINEEKDEVVSAWRAYEAAERADQALAVDRKSLPKPL